MRILYMKLCSSVPIVYAIPSDFPVHVTIPVVRVCYNGINVSLLHCVAHTIILIISVMFRNILL